MAAVCLVGLLGLMPSAARGRVLISEFMALNGSTLQDVDGAYSDWIELVNDGTNTVDLLGWYLTDKASNLTKWAFPEVQLAPGQFLVVMASEKNRRVPGQQLHTNFKLDGAGEYLGLVHPDGVTVEFAYSPLYPDQDSDVSYGINADSSTRMVSGISTGRYVQPFPHIVTTWMEPIGFNDASWTPTVGGLGYETVPGPLAAWIQTPVPSGSGSLYTRYAFNLSGAETIDQLQLRVRFDDGFVAFLNGVEVAASNAPAVPDHTSLAIAARPPAEAVTETVYDLTPLKHVLLDGANLLGIQVLNVAASDGDLLLAATLTGIATNPVMALRYFAQPTPGTVNSGGVGSKSDAPVFSLEGGFYTNSQVLVLTAEGDNPVIRYTLDGSEPSATSPLYNAPLNIQSRVGLANDFSMIPTAPTASGQWSWLPLWKPPVGEVFKGTVVRARVFEDGRGPSTIITRTYLVDPAIHQRYGNLPVISLASDRKHLFDSVTGIYVPGSSFTGTSTSGNYYKGWEKPMHMEWYEPGGTVGFRQDLGVRIQGNTSVTSPHKGLSFYARAEYGKSAVTYPLFEGAGSAVAEEQEFKRFMLRGWGSYRGRGLLYDPFAQTLLDHADLDMQDYRLCVVFINGEYWGLQEVREAVKNSHYLEQTYDVDRTDPGYDVLYGGGPYPANKYSPSSVLDYSFIDEGDGTNWNETVAYLAANNMALPQHYAYAKSRIDVDNYILYMVHSAFTVKADWPTQNEAKYRARTPDGRFRWLQFDLDHSFHDSWQTDMLPTVFGHNIYSRLQVNTEFRHAFINCYADLMNTDFRADVMLARFDAMVATMKPYTNEFLRRWPITDGNNLDPHWANMRVNVANRTAFERQNVVNKFALTGVSSLTLDVASPGQGLLRLNNRLDLTDRTRGVTNGVYPWTGLYFRGVPVTCTAIPSDGYQFARWQGAVTNTLNPAVVTLAADATLTALFAPFEPSQYPLVISEIMYHPAVGAGPLETNEAEFVELFNAGASALNLRDVTFTEGIAFTFTNDFILGAGDCVALVGDLATFAARYDTNSTRIGGVFGGRLANSGETLRLKRTPYGPTLATVTYGDGREWPLTADGAGHSLVPLVLDNQVDGRLGHGAFWRASNRRHGSPGAPDPTPLHDVVLNEIMAHTDYSGVPGYDSNDWIELFNRGAGLVGLANWYLSDDADNLKKWAIPAAHSLGPGAWRSYDEVTGFHNPITNGFGLNKAGEEVYLSYLPGTAQDRVADAVAFKGQPQEHTWGRHPNGSGPWRQLTPTRDASNALPVAGLVISELMPHPASTTINQGNNINDEFVEIWNPTAATVTLDGAAGVWRLNGAVAFTFPPGESLPPGGYLVVVSFDPGVEVVARDAFLQTYGLTNQQVRMLGPFVGKLPNEGDRIALERPEPPDAVGEGASWILVDEVIYAPFAPWPTSTSATGHSLRRVGADVAGVLSTAWVGDMFPSPGLSPAKLAVVEPLSEGRLVLPYGGEVRVLLDDAQVVGAVVQVDILLDGNVLATRTQSPYTASLSGLSLPGRYVLQARLVDGAGVSTSAPLSVVALQVDNDAGATEVTETSARLNGRLAGDGAVDITVFWGVTDGGTNPVAWAHAESLGLVGEGVFSRVVGGLGSGQQYYYRVRATLPTGTGWAWASAAFRYSLSGWAHHLPIRVRDLTETDTLTNFPVLVSLSTNIAGFRYPDVVLPAGGDLRFAASLDGAVYPHEIEHWNTNGVSHIWVCLPQLPPGESTFLALWGNAQAAVPASATNGSVWVAGYERVLHFSAGMADAATPGDPAVDVGSIAGAGVAGAGRFLDGVDDQVAPGPATNWFGDAINAMTLSLWVRPTAKENATAIGQYGGGRDLPLSIVQKGTQWTFTVRDVAAVNAEHAVRPGEWQQLALVMHNGQARAYLNGVPSAATIRYLPFAPNRELLVGYLNGQTSAAYRQAGEVDEVRIAGRARSADWMRASYLTVASNAWVTTYGDPQPFVDSDADELPDAWEDFFFEELNLSEVDPEDDWDGDGMSNREEYVAGTDPTESDDRFHMRVIPLGGTGLRLEFLSVPAEENFGQAERRYAMEARAALADAGWNGVPAFTNVLGLGQTVSLTTNVPDASGFFRGRVWLVPLP